MSSLPKNPKPNIEEKKLEDISKVKNYESVIKEMVELVRENKAIIKKHLSQKNETIYG